MSVLEVLKRELLDIGIPYEFMRWSAPVNGVYVVGEHTEVATTSEDGYQESTMLLTATTRTTWADLMEIRDKIRKHFPPIYGLRLSTDSGSVVFFYEHSFPVDTGEADLKRIQINLKVKEWRNDQ